MVESKGNVPPGPYSIEIKPDNGVDPYVVAELTRENITKEIAFSAQGSGIHPEVPNKLIIHRGINARDIVSSVNYCMGEAISVNARVVLELLKYVPHTYKDLGNILNACTLGIQTVAEKEDANTYQTRLPEMGEYRWLRKWVEPMFDQTINRKLDPY